MQHLLRLAAAALAAVLPAQQTTRTAHPQETLQNGIANFAPFGIFSTGAGAEARAQFLIPKDELPSQPALLTGIELHALVGGTVGYASLQITAMPTTATSLSTTYAANLTGPTTVVLQANGLQVAWSTTSWVGIPFTQAYLHDGSSALLLDVVKVVAAPTGGTSYPFVTMTSSSAPVRNDRPQMVYNSGAPGSGAAGATSAFASTDPVSMRFTWSGTPTIRNRSDTGSIGGNQYAIGGTVTFTLDGQPGELWLLAAAYGFLPNAIAIPGLSGSLRLNGPVLFASGLLGAGGSASQLVNIPSQPALAGLFLAYQGATVDAATGSIALTNGSDHFINP
jgi:hypothetical protein